MNIGLRDITLCHDRINKYLNIKINIWSKAKDDFYSLYNGFNHIISD